MPRAIDRTAAEALDTALRIIEAEYPDDYETRKACAVIVSECLRAQTLIRSDSQEHASRPRW